MTYDPTDGYVVLFGGDNGTANLCGTWTFANGQWNDTGLGCVGSPPLRSFAVMTFDASDGYVLLYGGENLSYPYLLDDTWSYVNGAWTTWSFRPGMDPGPLLGEQMAYDAADGYVLLYGGLNSSNVVSDYTYAWFAGNWTNLTTFVSGTPPPARVRVDGLRHRPRNDRAVRRDRWRLQLYERDLHLQRRRVG